MFITLIQEITHYAIQVFSGKFQCWKLSLDLVIEHNTYLSKFPSNPKNSIFIFFSLTLSEHFSALAVKSGTIFQYGRRQSVNTNVAAMEWFRGYFQSMNGGDRKWELVRGMWLVLLALQRKHGARCWEYRKKRSFSRNQLLLQFTTKTALVCVFGNVQGNKSLRSRSPADLSSMCLEECLY